MARDARGCRWRGMANRSKRPNARITGGGKLQTRRAAVPAGAELTVAYGYRL